ncbi:MULTISPECIES: helix-turn-helix transcriptional regulator [Bacillus cereus group]|uniref:helix-turn-helix transcriptional regulator n=1 Tax=Bacillus cereus group TaxID=86661 RepID=UPI000CD9E969|nr:MULTISPECIES: helix-turn-helix transcriptional regulator [Bacillus cereus group]MBG9831879.1 hypothetical protein [Bacillus wiedmannii]UOB98868.1 hypothetical protein BTI679_62690 [Bacillus wiedmannii]
MTVKEEIRKKYLKPKRILKRERMARDITIAEMAITLGINRDAYSAKEKGKFSFSDYEMQVIKKKLGLPIEYLFFID